MYSVVKIGGFAFGIAACLLIALFIKDELSYDNQYPNADRIYRIIGSIPVDGQVQKWTSFPAPMAGVIKKDFPEVEKSGRLMPNSLFPGAGSNEVRTADKIESNHEDGFAYADQETFDIFSLPLVYGDSKHALTQPNSIVIAKSKADKYFPGQNPIGKVLYLNNNLTQPHTVTGVMLDIPSTSHLRYDFLLAQAGIEWWKGEQASWDAQNYIDYIVLKQGTDPKQFEKKLRDDIANNYYLPTLQKEGDKNAVQELANYKLVLQPVGDIHLRSYDIDDGLKHGDIRFVWLFAAIAGFILVIACINFINLSTAKSANRAREVGLRKVIGSYRSGLVKQFLTESLLVSLLSFVAGILLAWVLLPYFNILASKQLIFPWAAWWFAPVMLLACFVVGVAAGLYPSFYLSSFKPISVLKGQLSSGSKGSALRNGLVVFQFTASIILIISTTIIYNQVHYLLNKNVGFDKDQVMLIQGTNTIGNEVNTFKTRLLSLPQVKSVSISDFLPVEGTKRNGNSMWNEGKANSGPGADAQFWTVDIDYIKTLGIKIVDGRDFLPNMATDSQQVIINQTLVNDLHLKNPVGKIVTNSYAGFRVLGVIQDFNFESMHGKVGPMVLHLGSSPGIVSVKMKGGDVPGTIALIAAMWKNFAPGQPLRYTFLDESFSKMYADVQSVGRIFTSFAILAIIIACLGLFGLSAFMAEQRSKEIGIRKVLGASIQSIATLLSGNFVKLVLIAIVIATPVAWWGMTKWLQEFAYRAPISVWIFVFAGVSAIVIAVVTVSFQSIKAALMNPVKAIKVE